MHEREDTELICFILTSVSHLVNQSIIVRVAKGSMAGFMFKISSNENQREVGFRCFPLLGVTSFSWY